MRLATAPSVGDGPWASARRPPTAGSRGARPHPGCGGVRPPWGSGAGSGPAPLSANPSQASCFATTTLPTEPSHPPCLRGSPLPGFARTDPRSSLRKNQSLRARVRPCLPWSSRAQPGASRPASRRRPYPRNGRFVLAEAPAAPQRPAPKAVAVHPRQEPRTTVLGRPPQPAPPPTRAQRATPTPSLHGRRPCGAVVRSRPGGGVRSPV
jgi:hypothetical protein